MAIFTSKDLPNVRPVADFNFAATKTLDKKITFSRGSIGTYADELGVIRYASNNVPRFDHDPSTGRCLGLLVEESRTNYEAYSVDINTGKNHFTGSTLTANAAIAPDGTTTATRITGSGSDEATRLGWNTQSTSNTQYNVFSVFVKADSGTPILGFYSNTFVASNGTLNIDLSDGSTNVINDNSGFFSEVVAYPNGWYRVSVMGGPGIGSGGSWNINLVPSLTSARAATSGSNASASYLVWGVQEELASGPFPTSYIPTSGSTVTRSQDQAVIKKENFTKVFDTGFNSFSALIDYDNLSTSDDSVNRDILTLWGETTGYTDRISISKDNASPYHIETRAFGNNSPIFNNGNLTAASKAAVQKLAFSWNVPSYSSSTGKAWKFSFSGADVDNVTAASTQGLPALTRMGIGINPTRLTESAGHAHFKRVAIYNQVLSDEELKSISAI